MKNFKSLNILALCLLSPVVNGFELDINISNLTYDTEDFSVLESQKHIGSISAPSFYVKTKDSNFSLQRNYKFQADILADSKWLYLANDIFDFSYALNSIPGLEKVRNTELEDVNLYTDDDEINLTIGYAQFLTDSEGIKVKHLGLTCELQENIIDAAGDVVNSCLNQSHFFQRTDEQTQNTRVEVEFGDSFLGLDVKDGQMSENKMSFLTGSLMANFDGFQLSAQSLDIGCEKKTLTEDAKGEDVARYCLRDANIKIPELKFKDESLKLLGHVNVDEFYSNGKKLQFSGSRVDITYEDLSFDIKNLKANCKLPSLGSSFQYSDIASGCMESSKIGLEDIDLTAEGSDVKLKDLELELTDDSIMLDSPLISYTDKESSLKLSILNSKIECKKILNQELSMSSILKGCFDSSRLTIPKVELTHDTIDTNIQINRVSIDNQRLEFGSPKGSYKLNGQENEFKNLKVGCKLDASYDMATNLEWKSILKNCLHSSSFEMDYLIGVYNGDGFFRRMGSKLKNFGIKGINDVKFTSEEYSGDNFKLVISPELIGFIPINITIKGKINFDREKTQIKIKIKKVKFYKVIPAKFFVEYILNSFVKEESLVVDGDELIINL